MPKHAHAPIMLKQGIHPKIVQERLGHANIAGHHTGYILAHVSPGMHQSVAVSFDEAFTDNYNKLSDEAVL